VRYPLVYDHGWQVDFHSLQSAVTSHTRGVIVVNPISDGHSSRQMSCKRTNNICANRGLAIIADEVFSIWT